jgi:arylsulfatase A-like enzyme
MISRRDFLAGAAASAALPGAILKGAAARPNILFLMVDEMRWDAMGCEGHPVVRTPALDKLAKEGLRFSNTYTVSPVCCPARASQFTGRYAHVHGVTMNGVPANDGEIFLPSILRHHGYHTAISGKLHYTPMRFDYGFDQFWSFTSEGPTPEIGYIEFLRKKHGSPGKWPRVDGSCPWPDDPLGRDVGLFKYPKEDFETDWIADRSIDYLRSRKGKGQPWLLFTSWLKPHSPSVQPEPYFSMYDPKAIPVPKLPPDAHARRMGERLAQQRHLIDDEQMMRRMSAIYYGAITGVDAAVARILAELERLGMADNTLILFTADHGNMLGDHMRWFKGVQYEGSAHIPLLWKGPKGSSDQGGKVVDKLVENTDLMPSILETVGLPVPQGVQGKSFLNMARRHDPKWKNHAFSQLRSGSLVRDGYKLIDNSLDGTGEIELYHLPSDRKEARDLSGDPKQKDRIAHMRKDIATWRANKPAPIKVPGMATPEYAHISQAERDKAVRGAPDNNEDAPARRARPRKKG